jgi:X-X-X-Leu-X-X-Gly heptad repeat protein
MAILPALKPSALIELARATVGQVVETAAAVATIPIRAVSLLGQAELLVTRITVLTDDATALIARVGGIVAEAQVTASAAAGVVGAAEAITSDAGRIVVEASAITDGAGQLVSRASGITDGAGELVSRASGITGGAAELVDGASGVLAGAATATDAASAVVARAEAATAEVVQMLDVYVPILRKAGPLAAHFVEELSPEEVTAAIRMVDELPKLREHLVDDVLPLLGKLDQVGPDLHNLLEVTKDLHLAIAGLPGLKLLRRRGEERVAEEEESATNARK